LIDFTDEKGSQQNQYSIYFCFFFDFFFSPKPGKDLTLAENGIEDGSVVVCVKPLVRYG
jgi:hypothetical protein